jgi:L-ascorbate metabolism protein UlaG (beta-lactamase superfamily)
MHLKSIKSVNSNLFSLSSRGIPLFLLLVLFLLLLVGCSAYQRQLLERNKLSSTLGAQVDALEPPRDPNAWSDETLTVSWVGHATVLINFYGTTIMTDPVLLERLAPPYLGGQRNLGMRRITECPYKFKDLPPIDLVLLSHAHHDHWDIASLNFFADSTDAIIPRETRDLIPKGHFGDVTELDWGQSKTIGELTVRAFKVQHWGYRGGKPKGARGYNGYVLSKRGAQIVFFGDSAYHDRSSERRPVNWVERVGPGPYDLCILPIGDYVYRHNHMSPEEAWRIYTQLEGKKFLPIHWRTFILSPVPIQEPIERLQKVAAEEGKDIICTTPGKAVRVK